MAFFNAASLSAGRRNLRRAPQSTAATFDNASASEGKHNFESAETVQTRRDFSLSSGNAGEVRKYQLYVRNFNIEVWLDALGSATFDTIIVPVSRPDAKAILRSNVHEQLQKEGLTLDDPALGLDSLVERLGSAMQMLGAQEHGVFVKTSSRSAKDFADPAVLRDVFLTKRRLMGAESSVQNENHDMIAMSYASMALLRMRTPEQVMNIFSNSERIWHDMQLALACDSAEDCGDNEADGSVIEPWNESLAVRRWVEIEPDMEFRCFICGGTLTAVSQYRHLLHFPRLARHSAQVLQTLQEFVEDIVTPRLSGLFPKDDYILDLALELDPSQGANCILASGSDGAGFSAAAGALPITRTWVIEVNPFFDTTDSALYSWTKDASLLMGQGHLEGGGTNPVSVNQGGTPDFRFRSRPAKGASSLMYGTWRDIMASAEKKGT